MLIHIFRHQLYHLPLCYRMTNVDGAGKSNSARLPVLFECRHRVVLADPLLLNGLVDLGQSLPKRMTIVFEDVCGGVK